MIVKHHCVYNKSFHILQISNFNMTITMTMAMKWFIETH